MPPKAITSSVAFQDPQGNILANGSIVFDLSTPAEIIGGGQVVPTRVDVLLTSGGLVPGAAVIWANDQITPSGTVYQVRIFNSNGLLVEGPVFWSITGTSPIDLSGMVPVSTATLSFSLPGVNSQIFTVNGTFTIPPTITKLKVTVVGGGGAGGGANNTNGGAGGGSGGASIKWLSGMTPGNTLTVTIGPGGTGVSAATGNNGTASSVSSGTQVITTITANGGLGGPGIGGASGVGGGGASPGTGGDVNFGGSGADSIPGTTVESGAGVPSIFGGGGNAPAVTGTGNAGSAPGASGSGALGGASGAGGNGANGIVIFEWVA